MRFTPCPYCGNLLLPQARYCGSCGKALPPASPISARQVSVTESRQALPQGPANSKSTSQASLLPGSGQLPLPADEPRYLKDSAPSLSTDVFLSYSRKDKDFVRTLVTALEAAKRSVWVDWNDIPPSMDWQDEINRGIEAASTFVFVLSPKSIRSEPCLKELEYALLTKKRIILLVFRKVDPQDVPEAIRALNWIFFTQSELFDIACKQLFFALDTDLDYWHQSARLLTSAKRWEQQSKERSRTLRGRELQEAERWLAEGAKKTPPPGPPVTDFISASRHQRTRTRSLLLAFVVVFLLMVGVAYIGGPTVVTLNNFINSTLLEKQNLLKNVEALTPDVSISEYKKIFGDPKFINQNGSQYFINQPGVKKFKEYVFINKYFYLDAVTDASDRVQHFALTIRDKAFNPTFTMPVSQTASIAQITLGVSKFKDIPTTPMSISGCVGAHDVYYHEIYYFGNQGRYEQFGFGLNEAGYLANKYEDYIPSLSKINLCLSPTGERPTSTEQDLENLQPMRTKTIFNTYAVSAPNVSIEDYNMKMDLGVIYDQVRTIHE